MQIRTAKISKIWLAADKCREKKASIYIVCVCSGVWRRMARTHKSGSLMLTDAVPFCERISISLDSIRNDFHFVFFFSNRFKNHFFFLLSFQRPFFFWRTTATTGIATGNRVIVSVVLVRQQWNVDDDTRYWWKYKRGQKKKNVCTILHAIIGGAARLFVGHAWRRRQRWHRRLQRRRTIFAFRFYFFPYSPAISISVVVESLCGSVCVCVAAFYARLCLKWSWTLARLRE